MLCEIGPDILPNIVKFQEDIRRMPVLSHKITRGVFFQIPTWI